MRKKKLPTPLSHATKLRYDLIEWHNLTQKELTERDEKGSSLLTLAVIYGHWTNLPPKLKRFSLTQPAQGNDKIIHLMARKGKVNTIPKEFVTDQLLSLKGNKGETVYHVLAQENYANHIDKSLWTRKALTLKSNNSDLPLHSIVQCSPGLLPEDITLEDMLIQDSDNDSALYLWARGLRWDQIPDKFLIKQTLEMKVGYGDFETLMHHIANRFKNDQVLYSTNHNNPLDTKMKKLLSKISDQLLKSLSRNENPSLSRHIKSELAKRKMVKELSNSEQYLEI